MDVALIPVITALVEVAKRAGLDSKFAPLIAIAVGVVLVILKDGPSIAAVIDGLTFGLGSMGLYSGGKAVVGK